MIIIDSREESLHRSKIKKIINKYDVSMLEVGDYIIQGVEKNVIIERKTFNDLITSSYDRLWEQLKSLSNSREQNYEPLLILEINYIFDRTKNRPLSVNTFLKLHPEKEKLFYSILYAITQFSVPIIYTRDFEGTCNFIVELNEKLGEVKEKRDFPERSGFRKDWSIEKKREYLLDAFGHEFAKTLKNITLKQLLDSPLTREEMWDKLPKKYESGRSIPRKKLEEFMEVLGF